MDILAIITGLIMTFTGFFGIGGEPEPLAVGGFSDPFLSLQVGTDPTADYILSTDGTDSTWIANAGGGGGSGFASSTNPSMATYFVATSTTQASLFPYASSTAFTADFGFFNNLLNFNNATGTQLTLTDLYISGDHITDFNGAGLDVTAGVLTLNTSGTWSGNAGTATALAANGGNCSAGSYPLGVDASGAVEDCTDATTEIDSAISTHAGVNDAHQALVTLAGTPDYLSLSGQEITLAKLDITDDTNLVAGTNITLTTNTLNVDDAFLANDGDTGTGTYDFSGATLKKHNYPTFTYATSTAWSATTTIPIGVAYTAESWSGVKCYTDVGTLFVSFSDGTNLMNTVPVTTTVGVVALSVNNTFAADEKRYVDIGTPASAPTKISCTLDYIENN